jgi:hypothetical protein
LAQGLDWGMFLLVTAALAFAPTTCLHCLFVGAVHLDLEHRLQKYEGDLFYSF